MVGTVSTAARASVQGDFAIPPWLLPLFQRLAGIVGVLALLELITRTGIVNPRYFPPMSTVFARLAEEAASARLWSDVLLTLQGWAAGLGIAVLVGVLLGMVAGLWDPVFHGLRPIVEFLRPVPSVALIPLAILMFGAGMESKIFMAAFAATWPILIQSMYGVRDLDPVQMETARSYRIPGPMRFRRVLLPSALPYIATGMRVSSATALALAVSTELIIGAPGLGQTINIARASGAPDLMYALIVVAGLLGWLLNVVFVRVERSLLRWHPTYREVAQ